MQIESQHYRRRHPKAGARGSWRLAVGGCSACGIGVGCWPM